MDEENNNALMNIDDVEEEAEYAEAVELNILLPPVQFATQLGLTTEDIKNFPELKYFSMQQFMIFAYEVKKDLQYQTFVQMANVDYSHILISLTKIFVKNRIRPCLQVIVEMVWPTLGYIIEGLAEGNARIIDQRNNYLEDILNVQRDGIPEAMRASWIGIEAA